MISFGNVGFFRGKDRMPVSITLELPKEVQYAINCFIRQVHALSFQEICRLYRNALKLLDSWAIDRGVFIEEACLLRAKVSLTTSLTSQHKATFCAMSKYVHQGCRSIRRLVGKRANSKKTSCMEHFAHVVSDTVTCLRDASSH